MRSFIQLGKDLVKKPPYLFPLVALFHVFAFVYTLWVVHSSPFPSLEWLQFLWVALYLILWLAVCDLRKWAGIVYILLTAANLALFLSIKTYEDKLIYTNVYFPLDIVFSFFILLFYKRLS